MDFEGQQKNGLDQADEANLQDGEAARAPAPSRGNARVLVPGADNVVVLPAGTELDNVQVSGRDLVIVGADGVRYVILDGAIIVPQLVVGGVTIPAANLAALLTGNEPEPAAGPPRSSGGNFADAVGPLQAAYGLGDLLPYTELNFPQQEEREVIPQPLNRQPDVIIITPNQPAGAQSASAQVSEAGLPARGTEPAGSNAAANTETTSGIIEFAAPDGLASIALNGVVITAVGQTFATPFGVLTITSIAPGVIGYSYTLTDNTLGQSMADTFVVTVTDADGDVATASLDISVVDDAPDARNDTDAVPAGSYAPQTGNVITGAGTTSGAAGADVQGADGARITAINGSKGNDTTFDASANLVVDGQYGTLTIKADGSYSYTRAAGTPGGVTDTFTYTLTDNDGTADTATLAIAIGDSPASVISIPSTGAATTVNEAGLPTRPGEAPGTNAPAPSETASGTITVTAPDGPLSVAIGGVTVTGPGQIITLPQGALTITAYNPVTGEVGYSFTLADNTAGDTTTVSIPVTVTDIDGDSDTKPLVITIVDDAPRAIDDAASQGSENAAVTVNVLANDIQGADSVQPSTVQLVPGTLSGAGTLANNGNGTFTYTPAPAEQGTVTFRYSITDGDGDSSVATVTITLRPDSVPTISTGGDTDVLEAGLPARGSEPAGSQAAGNGEFAAGTIAITTGGDTIASLTVNGVNLTAGGSVSTAKGTLTVISDGNGGYSYSYQLTDNTLSDPDSDSFALVITDSDGSRANTTLTIAIVDDVPLASNDTASLQAGQYGPIGGNVVTNDTQGADGATVSMYSGTGAAVAAGAVAQGLYGKLTIAADGTFSYTRDAGTKGGVTDTFSYTITDGDGDKSTATLTITIPDSGTSLNLPTSGTAGTGVAEAGLPAGSAAATDAEFTSGTIGFTAPDGPAILTIGGAPVVVGGTYTGTFGTLTVTAVGNGTIAYTYQLTTNTSGDATADGFVVRVTDQDGDFTEGTLRIDIIDDVPTARPDSDSVKEDGPLTATGNVITDAEANGDNGADTRGADGASVTGVAFGATGGTVGTPLAGAFGTLFLNADGSYSYTLDNANPAVQSLDDGETGSEIFTYTLTDGDGDLKTTTLTITINGTNDAPVIGIGAATVSEEGLAGANADGTGSIDTTNALVATGTISIADADGEPATVTLGDPGAVLTSNGAAVTWSGVGTATVIGSAGGAEVIRIAIDNSGSFTVTLSGPVDHANMAVEDTRTFAVPVNVSDGTATVGTTLAVTIEDDSPIANPDSNSVAEGAQVSGNVLTGAGADQFGADGAASTNPMGGIVGVAAGSDTTVPAAGAPGTAIVTALGTLTLNADGTYTYDSKPNATNVDATDTFTYTIRDADGDLSTTTLTISVANVAGTVSDTDVDVDESGLDQIGSQAVPNGEFDTNGQIVVTNAAGTFTFTLTNGPANPYGVLTLDANTGAYSYTLTGPVDNATADDGRQVISGVESYGYQVTDQNGNLIGAGTIAVNVRDDVPTLTVSDTPISAIEGQTANGTFALTPGADGVTEVTVTFGAASQTLSLAPGQAVTLVQPTGTLVVRSDFTFSFTAALNQDNDAVPAPAATFTITATDGDGDTSADALTIAIVDGPAAGNAQPITLAVDEQFLNTAGATGSAAGVGTVSDSSPTLSFTAGSDTLSNFVFGDVVNLVTTLDGAGTDIFWTRVNDTTITGALTNGGPAAITLTLAPPAAIAPGATANVTVTITLADNLPHALAMAAQTQGLGFVNVLASDSDGDTATGRVNLTVTDDVPTANADPAIVQAAENTAVVIDALANDVFGADGVNTADGTKVFVSAQATYGTVTYDPATGKFTYTPAKGAGSNGNLTDTFSYTIVDGDGDPSTATVTLALAPDSTPKVVNVVASVDDDALANGNAAADAGTDLNANLGDLDGPLSSEATFRGQISVDFGNDGGTVSFANLDGTSGIVGTERVIFTWDDATKLLTATVASNDGAAIPVAQTRAGTALFTVSLAPGGQYVVTQLDNVLHSAGGLENDASVALFYLATDGDDGDTDATGKLTITFDDDVPTAIAEAGNSVAEGATTTGSFDFATGADGAAVTAINGTALAFDPVTGFSQGISLFDATGLIAVGTITAKADGTYSFTAANPLNNPVAAVGTFTVTDGDGDSSTANLAFTVTDANAPIGGAAAAHVDDDGLPAGNPNSTIFDLDPADGKTATGTLNFTPGGDTPVAVTFATANNSFAVVGIERVQYTIAGNVLTATVTRFAADGVTVQPREGTTLFTVTITDPASGAYNVTLINNILHSGGPNEENPTGTDAAATISFTITDSDNSQATATLEVTFDDDAPSVAASAIALTQATENTAVSYTIANGTDFVAGADGVDLSKVTFTQATQGTITYDGAGKFTYTPASGAGSDPANLTDSFTFTVRDGDNDVATRTITIALKPDSVPVAVNQVATVDDDGLPGGNPVGDASNGDDNANATENPVTASEAVFSGSFASSTGTADAPFTYSLAAAVGSGLVGTETVDYTYANNILTATVAAGQTRTGTILFTVKIDNVNSGAYTVTLKAPIAHDPATGTADDDRENNASVMLDYTVSDSDTVPVGGDTSPGKLTINFDDDVPSAISLTGATFAEGSGTHDVGAAVTVLQIAGGADGLSTSLQGITFANQGGTGGTLAVDGNGRLIYTSPTSVNNTLGTVTETFSYTITDKDGDSVTRTVTFGVSDSGITNPAATNASVDEDDIAGAGGNPGGTGDLTTPVTTGTISYTAGQDAIASVTLSAAPTGFTKLDGVTPVNTYYDAANNQLVGYGGNDQTDIVFTVKLGAVGQASTGYTVTLLQPVRHPVGDNPATLNVNESTEDDLVVNLTATIKDADNSTTTAAFTVTIDDDSPVASNASATQPTENATFDIDVSYSPGADGLKAAGGVTFTQPTFGTVTLKDADTFTYTPAAGTAALSDSFTYTVTDKDGDTVTQTVSLTLKGDSNPTVTVTDVSVNEKGLPTGSGELADSFDGGANTINGDTSETASGTFTIATGNDALTQVELLINGMWTNVTGGGTFTTAKGSLTITVNGAGQYAYTYTLGANYATHTVQGAGDTVAGESFAVRVTDSDGDVTTSTPAGDATINVTVIDDAPVIFQAQTPITIANTANPVPVTGDFDFTVGADRRADFTGANSDFSTITLTGTVGSQTITPTNLVRTGETATTATFTFSFNYTASGANQTATGTLTFDKVAGTYTVDLNQNIQASVSPPSVSGSTSIVGYEPGTATVDTTQPNVTVAQITTGLFVQFTGYNGTIVSTPAPNDVYANGEVLTGSRDFVSISGSANGVAGDTLGKSEVLDLDFFTTDPKGFDTLTPDARVATMFIKFDGIGNNEDLIVVLKLYDTVTGTYTTRALYVANGDIIKGTAPAAYSGITLDNNDGLIIIETNDYRLTAADANLVLVGAQITSTDEGITGPAINFNGTTGAAGGSTTGQNLSNDTNDTGFKVSDIGFLTTTTTIQNATLNFTFQLKDSEGDLSASQTLTANVVNGVGPVVLDLDGDGAEFAGLAAGTTFDYGQGAVHTAWVGKDDGLLAIDLDGSGTVNSGKEIVFGSDELTDLQGLAAQYDTNRDGKLDADDAEFGKFGVWQDADGDGISDAGEFHSLSDLGITSINLVSDGKGYSTADGDVVVAGTSTYARADGSTGLVSDAFFAAARNDQRTAELATTAAVAGAVVQASIAAARLPSADIAHDAEHRLDQTVFDRSELADDPAPAAIPSNTQFFAANDGQATLGGQVAPTYGHASEEPEAQVTLTQFSAAREYVDHQVHEGPSFAQPQTAFGGFDGAEGTMAALLSIGAGGTELTAAEPMSAGPLKDALSDVANDMSIDAIVDHYAGTEGIEGADRPVMAMVANDIGSGILLHDLHGGFVPGFAATMPDMTEDAHALAAATA